MQPSKPELVAEFNLDSEGNPIAVESSGLKHYEILLGIKDPPADVIGVTYRLDDSYYDPLRESYDSPGGFRAKITSYGDYVIEAQVKAKPYPFRLRKGLHQALQASYPQASESIKEALKFIEDH